MNSYLANPKWQRMLSKLQLNRSKKNSFLKPINLEPVLLWQAIKNNKLTLVAQLLHGRAELQ